MICKIADLIVDVPEAGGLASRCQSYLWNSDTTADIVIREKYYRWDKKIPEMTDDVFVYMESASQFCGKLIQYDGFYLHSSAVVLDGKAYLFSGSSGVGKSTHTRLWQQQFGPEAAVVINDDKPALRRIDGVWYAYGTPWCGKDGINRNACAPVAGVCFLKKAADNRIRRLNHKEAMPKILNQTIYKVNNPTILNTLLSSLELFLQEIPVYELENRPESAAAQLSYDTMCPDALR